MKCLVAPTLALLVLASGPASSQGVSFEAASELIPFTHQGREFLGEGLAGAAWFDYDRDGDVDLYLANGRTRANALFRNDGSGAGGTVFFTEVAASAGVANGLGNCGAVAADLDNDGYQELILTGDGSMNQFTFEPRPVVKVYANNGGTDGIVTFTDISESAGIEGPDTQMMVALGDIDNDTYLDVFLTAPGSLLPPTRQHRSRLYRNNGDLTFTDISAAAGIDTAFGSCVVLFSDYNRDGWSDIFVGNCNNTSDLPTPIELFRNNGDLTFTDVSAEVGLREPLGFWMGFAPGDFDNDGDIDLFVTNLGPEADDPLAIPGDHLHALFRNDRDAEGAVTYTNVGAAVGVDAFEFGWGSVMRDFDNDGWTDLFFAGSAIGSSGGFYGPDSMANPGRLFFNRRDDTFTLSQRSLPYNFSSDYSSGVAAADYDGDGFEDLLVAVSDVPELTLSGQPVLLRNLGNGNHWIQVRALGMVSNRDGVGARFTVYAGGRAQTQEVYAGSSFASMSSQILTFGLGEEESAVVEVDWPSGFHYRRDVAAGSFTEFPEIPCDAAEMSPIQYRLCLLIARADRKGSVPLGGFKGGKDSGSQ